MSRLYAAHLIQFWGAVIDPNRITCPIVSLNPWLLIFSFSAFYIKKVVHDISIISYIYVFIHNVKCKWVLDEMTLSYIYERKQMSVYCVHGVWMFVFVCVCVCS